MHIPTEWLSCLSSLFNAFTLSPFDAQHVPQTPMIEQPSAIPPPLEKGPAFAPPYSAEDPTSKDTQIICNYTASVGFKQCHGSHSRGCWLRNPDNGTEYNITTDYETRAPLGTTRRYTLDVNEMALAPDGVAFAGKVFNGSYPGPWIQACWGDDIEITVRNHLWYNGTSVHWHGIRQLGSTEQDGVGAVTQCPIAPGKEYTYKFRALQYGTSWYHSHYSLQYGDGVAGPMTIYGPSSANYTAAVEPILMTDWNHRSAFQDWSWIGRPNATESGAFNMTNILLNGKGRYQDPVRPIGQPERYKTVFAKGKSYLLRLINTAVETTFVFSIDGHKLKVVGMDFVPIEPYTTTSILIGIGQRYHVIVQADPFNSAPDDNYWIRTAPALGCGRYPRRPDERTGILRYDAASIDDPQSRKWDDILINCSDEPYDKLVPVLKWNVSQTPINSANEHDYVIRIQPSGGRPYQPAFSKGRWAVDQNPLWLNYSEPTVLNKDAKVFPDTFNVVTHAHAKDAWIYMAIAGNATKKEVNQTLVGAAHPIHLHGHDFALLYQSTKIESYTNISQLAKEGKLKYDNPPRRDVVLVPGGGFVVIAFKADNPGAWLVHCHIAPHASSGLGYQVLENPERVSFTPEKLAALKQTCGEWNTWWGNSSNHYNTHDRNEFQDDSGI